RHPAEHLIHGIAAEPDRFAEVEAQRTPEVVGVLHDERVIEPHLPTQGVELGELRVGAEDHECRVAGNDAHHDEDEGDSPPKHEDREEQPTNEVGGHYARASCTWARLKNSDPKPLGCSSLRSSSKMNGVAANTDRRTSSRWV